jgi:CO/xanthine dehydrogenase Mo-binding subunit
MLAARDFKVQLLARLSAKLGVSVEAVRIDNDRVIISNKSISFEEACAEIGAEVTAIRSYGVFNPDSELDFHTFKGSPYPTYTYATQLAELEVDIETGKVNVKRYWAAHDAGRIVNPMGAEGQIEGGVVMGLGMALWEKIVRNGGFIQNPGMRDYLLPGAKDAPPEITSIFVENLDETGPFGAKGVAEASLIPVPAAVAAAIHDAVGIRLNHMPMEAQTILEELRRQA